MALHHGKNQNRATMAKRLETGHRKDEKEPIAVVAVHPKDFHSKQVR